MSGKTDWSTNRPDEGEAHDRVGRGYPGQGRHREQFLEAIGEQARNAFTKEPGCVSFDVVCDLEDDHHFWFYEMYEDEAALTAHRETPHFPAWLAATTEHEVEGSRSAKPGTRVIHHSSESTTRRQACALLD